MPKKISLFINKAIANKMLLPLLVLLGFAASFCIPAFHFIDSYLQLILMYLGINVILTVSLNLVNGYMGEFSVGHAGFMAIGAYTASFLTVRVFPDPLGAILFPAAILAGGLCAGIVGLAVAVPSFRTRGDYLALVTLAFTMIIKSVIENLDFIGGPRGFLGMRKLSTLPWVFFWCVLSIGFIRNLVYSKYGRGIQSIREDEIASSMMGVHTASIKIFAFAVSSFFAGIAGGLYAHLVQFINPRTFDILKSTDILIMVYLGGIGSIFGSIIGALIYTAAIELLRPLGVWRMVFMPLVLVFLMLFRPQGILGLKEAKLFIPYWSKQALNQWLQKKREVHDAS